MENGKCARRVPEASNRNFVVDIGGWGGESFVDPKPGNRFVSFVRASGRGEAKLRGRARDISILVLGLF